MRQVGDGEGREGGGKEGKIEWDGEGVRCCRMDCSTDASFYG